jgi:glycosyltransferase involved in cell wall biosynthesis
MIVEQYLPAFHYGDAIGNSTLAFDQFLKKKGIDSRIIALTIDECLRDHACFLDHYTPVDSAIKILHFAIPSILTDLFLGFKKNKVLIYHNITPPQFFVDFSSDLVRFTQAGREHLAKLQNCCQVNIADSAYNAQELIELGFENVSSFPIMIDLDAYRQTASPAYGNLIRDERKNIVFVGRITPNKKIEDLIKTVFFYKKYLSPAVRLIIAGNTNTLPKYFHAVHTMAGHFLLNAEDVFFTGHIPFAELLAVYRSADLFMSMSEHEGFCLPLIESCFFSIPVIAFDTGAVAETLGGGGLLVKTKQHDYIAGLAYELLSSQDLANTLKIKQQQRIQSYQQQSDPEILLKIITDALLDIH